jgi:hypothetical protein
VNPVNRHLTTADVITAGSGRPSRGFIYGPEGAGKTSLACAAPRPIVVQTRGETGLETLIDAGRVPETPHFPEISTWSELLQVPNTLRTETHQFRTLVIDALNGAERLCHEHVCQRDFGGRWGRDGFTAYMTGYDSALGDWRELLSALDRLRAEKNMAILALCHSRISTFKNPEGSDFDRFTPELHPKTWALTHRWADYVLFLNFETYVDSGKTKPKGVGGTRRVLHTERTAAFDAKNRHGLPPRIECGSSAVEAWSNLVAAMRAGRTTKSSTEQPGVVLQAESTQS